MLRNRLRQDAGLSLAELIVAIFILSVSLFALLAAMVTSVAAVRDQRMRSEATRVAQGHLERVQALGYDDVEEGDHTDGPFPGVGGAQYTVSTSVKSVEATDIDASGDDAKLVTSTVTWTNKGVTRSSTYTTLLTPVDLYATQEGIITVMMTPDPTTIEEDGTSTEPVTVAATLNYPTASVRVFWRDDDGSLKSVDLVKTGEQDETNLWTGTISNIVRKVDADEEDPELKFSVTAGALSTVHGLRLRLPEPDVPVIGVPTVTPHPIMVERARSQCRQDNRCLNVDALTFTVRVEGLTMSTDENNDAVRVRFLLHDGTQQEVALTRDPFDLRKWSVTVPVKTYKFMVGLQQPFVFNATRASDGKSVERTANWQVSEA